MKTTILAATLALLVGAPLVASASETVPSTNGTPLFVCYQTAQPPVGCVPAVGQAVRRRLIGPFELHHGLLPNGLAPNPLTYG